MKVTGVSFNYLQNRPSTEKVKAYAKVILDKELIITGIKVIVTDTKRFIVFPEEKLNPNKTRGEHVVVSLVNPIKRELRDHITNAVFEKFDADTFNPINRNATAMEDCKPKCCADEDFQSIANCAKFA